MATVTAQEPTSPEAPPSSSVGSNAFGFMQKVGKSLMLPVSVLPVAGILLGVGGAVLNGAKQNNWDLPSVVRIILEIMQASGNPIFGALPLIFAIGVALGFSKNDGVAALAATVGYLVMIGTMGVIGVERGVIDLKADPFTMLGIPTVSTGVFGGIIVGLVAALLFNKYYRISLPPYLGFFAGKRFVPIVTEAPLAPATPVAPSCIEITLAGAVLRVVPGTDSAQLTAVLRAVRVSAVRT